MITNENNLTVMQQKFAENIVKGLTQAEAYRKAGYSVKSIAVANVNACRLLKNANILCAIGKLRTKIEKKSEWDRVRLIRSFQDIFERANQNEVIYDKDGNKTGEYKFDSSGACRALENITKIIGAYTQIDGDRLTINQFLLGVQQKYGFREAK